MSDTVKFVLCVLWEDELRIAAKSLQLMQAASEDEFPEKARDALNACLVALHGLTEDKTAVMVGAAGIKKQLHKRGTKPTTRTAK